MNETDQKWIRFRLSLVIGLGGILFIVTVLRAVQLQLWEGPRLKRYAHQEFQKKIPRTHKRGVIYDRQRQELALTAEMESIFTHSRDLENPERICRTLAPVLGLDRQRLSHQLSQGKGFVFLKRRARSVKRSGPRAFPGSPSPRKPSVSIPIRSWPATSSALSAPIPTGWRGWNATITGI
jgi:cell division protein FtsI/penicillin-binding protein 2